MADFATRRSPRVSVVIYNYNYGRYVQAAIESVLSQTYRDLEVVALDNGSTDGSPDLLRRMAQDERVRILLRPDNSLLGSRFNEPLALCRGEFVALLYADDYFLPRRIERQMACFDNLGPEYGVVYSPCWMENVATGKRWLTPVLGRSGSVLKDFVTESHGREFVLPASTLIRRECLERYPFYPDLDFEGEGIYLKLALRYKFHCLDEPVAVMRDHASNLGKAIRYNAAVLKVFLRRLEAEPEFPADLRVELAAYRGRKFRDYCWQGVRMLADGPWARACMAEAVRSDPKQLFHPRTLAGFMLSWLPRWSLRLINPLASQLMGIKGVPVVSDIAPR